MIFLLAYISLVFGGNPEPLITRDFHVVLADSIKPVLPDTTEVALPDTTELAPEGRPRRPQPHFDGPGRERAQQPERRPEPPLVPMRQEIPTGFQTVFTDSLLRWEQWYNIAERENSRTGAITYRLGANGRHDGIMFRAIEPRHRRVYFDGIPVHDPVTNSLNSNLMPIDRMKVYAEQSDGAVYRSWYELDRFYVTKPLTWINFEETARNVRRAEAIFTANFNRRTNMELAYRGNNDDADYRRNQLSGRQASIRFTRYLSERWAAQAMLFYNSFQMNEPEGFQIEEGLGFHFEPTLTNPVSQNSRSSIRNTMVSATLYYRPDEEASVSGKAHIYQKRYRRFYYAPDDTSFYRTITWGGHATARLRAGRQFLEPYINLTSTTVDKDLNQSLARTAWNMVEAGAKARIEPLDFIRVDGWSSLAYRSDDESGFEAGYRFEFNPGGNFRAYQSFSIGKLIPSIQQKYWLTGFYSGDAGIRPEQIGRIEAGISWGRGWLDAVGIRAYMSEIRSPIVNDLETGMFINIDDYRSVGGEAFAGIETKKWEINLSATAQKYMSGSDWFENRFLDGSGIRIWNRLSVFYKDYFFDFATFARVGMSVMFSPNSYFSSRYIPMLDIWDPVSDSFELPGFFRADLEATARIRSFMFLFKYENVFNEVGQLGYFETAPYPMPPRRYRIGVRLILRN